MPNGVSLFVKFLRGREFFGSGFSRGFFRVAYIKWDRNFPLEKREHLQVVTTLFNVDPSNYDGNFIQQRKTV